MNILLIERIKQSEIELVDNFKLQQVRIQKVRTAIEINIYGILNLLALAKERI